MELLRSKSDLWPSLLHTCRTGTEHWDSETFFKLTSAPKSLCPFLKACYPRCQSLLEVLVKMCQQRTAECKQISVLPVTFTMHTQQITCFPSPAKLVKWQSMGETNRKNRCIIWLLQCYSHLSWSKCTAMASLQVKLSEISVWSTSSRRLFCFHLSLLGCTKAITQSWKTLTDVPSGKSHVKGEWNLDLAMIQPFLTCRQVHWNVQKSIPA